MRTARTRSPAPAASGSFSVVIVLYAALGAATVVVLRRMSRRWREPRVTLGEPYRTAPRPSVPRTRGGEAGDR